MLFVIKQMSYMKILKTDPGQNHFYLYLSLLFIKSIINVKKELVIKMLS